MTVFRSISETMFKVTHMVMRYAPVGVFALIAVTVANFGFSSPVATGETGAAGAFRHSVLRAGSAGNCGAPVRVKRLDLIRILKDELILAYSTASSGKRAAANY